MRVVIDDHEYLMGMTGTIVGRSGHWYLIKSDCGFEDYFDESEFSIVGD